MVKKFEDIFIRFGATHERDGQTDRRTIAALCIASHGKNRSGGFVPWANFYQKFEIFANFSYLSRYFYTDNVEISLKRRQTWESIKKKTNFRQNRSRGLPVLHCLREVMHIDF